jgi:hypothetical protein
MAAIVWGGSREWGRVVEAREALGLMGSRALAALCAIDNARCGLEALGAGRVWCWGSLDDARRCDSPQLVIEVCWKVPAHAAVSVPVDR